jgi:hypothetical protein
VIAADVMYVDPPVHAGFLRTLDRLLGPRTTALISGVRRHGHDRLYLVRSCHAQPG